MVQHEEMKCRPWYFLDMILLVANALTMAALLAIYGTALEYGEWEERDVVLLSSAPFIGTTYVVWLVAIVLRMCIKKDTRANMLQAFNSYWATANAVAGPGVYVTMSWMDTATTGYRYWSYTTQMSSIVVAAVGIYVARGVDVAKEQARQEEQLAGLKDAAQVEWRPPTSEFSSPHGRVTPPFPMWALLTTGNENKDEYSSTVITVGGKRKFQAVRRNGAMVVDNLRGDTVKVYVHMIGSKEVSITSVKDGVVVLPPPPSPQGVADI